MDVEESATPTETCEGCKKPAPMGSSGLYFCRDCRMAWTPRRKRDD
jgi:hypothetical protein